MLRDMHRTSDERRGDRSENRASLGALDLWVWKEAVGDHSVMLSHLRTIEQRLRLTE